MKQNIQNRTYITVRIRIDNNKYHVIAPKNYLKEICMTVWIGFIEIIRGMRGTVFRTVWWNLGMPQIRKGGKKLFGRASVVV